MVTPIATGTEFQVNTYVSGDQNEATVAALSGGGFAITWASYGQGGAGANIYAQRYDSAGVAVGDEFKVNSDLSQIWQQTPSITALSDGGFVVTWQSYLQDGSESGVYGQRYDSTGVATGVEFQINTTTDNWQWESAVTSLSDGGFVVSWSTFMQDGDSTGIAGQRFDAAGVAVGDEFLVNTYTADAQQRPEITGLSDGGFVVTWVSEGQDEAGNSTGYGIYGQRYNVMGVMVGGEFLVNTTTTDDQAFSSVSGLSNGGFVVTWASYDPNGSRYDIFSQIYDANSAPVGVEFLVNTTADGRQLFPSVTALNDGGFVIAWNDEEGAAASSADSIYDIYGQRYDSSGAPIGAEFLINTTTNDDQRKPTVSALSDGGFVAIWESSGQDGPGIGVYGQMFSYASGEFTSGDDIVSLYGPGQSVDGLGGDDVVTGADYADGSDIILGGPGNDTVNGMAGDDMLNGGAGNDIIDGGTGIDLGQFDTFGGAVIVDLNLTTSQNTNAAGMDTIINIENLIGGIGNDRFTGNTGANELTGQGGSDRLFGLGGADTLSGGDGNDNLQGGNGDDLIAGGIGRDTLLGGAGIDTLAGEAGNDQLRGGVGADMLTGGAGRDVLIGGDFVSGGFPGDGAADVFIFNNVSDSAFGATNRDIIRDFEQTLDIIDLSAIDAISGGGGDEAFTFIGNAAFSGTAGELRAFSTGVNTVVRADVDGDGTADLDIFLNGAMVMTAGDFVL